MPLIGNGIVAIWNDILPEMRDSFFEWHPREHMQERMGVPGFRRGRRYIAVGPGIEFFTMYEAAEPEILVSQAYRERLADPTEWSLSVLPNFRNNLRGVCRKVFSTGYADGGHLLAIRFSQAPDADSARDALESRLASLLEEPRIVGVHHLACDPELSAGNSSLQRGRTISLPDQILLVEASTREALASLSARLAQPGELLESLAARSVEATVYSLEYQVMS